MEANSSSSQVTAVGGKSAAGARNVGGARNVSDAGKAFGRKDNKKPKICYGLAEKDILQGIRNAQHATRPVRSVAKSDIFN